MDNTNLIYQIGSLLEDLEFVVSGMKLINGNNYIDLIKDLEWLKFCLSDLDTIILSMKHVERNF
jgi:hypothetical protein